MKMSSVLWTLGAYAMEHNNRIQELHLEGQLECYEDAMIGLMRVVFIGSAQQPWSETELKYDPNQPDFEERAATADANGPLESRLRELSNRVATIQIRAHE
jgi:hypothetical protein